jgi:hypothetical protein
LVYISNKKINWGFIMGNEVQGFLKSAGFDFKQGIGKIVKSGIQSFATENPQKKEIKPVDISGTDTFQSVDFSTAQSFTPFSEGEKKLETSNENSQKAEQRYFEKLSDPNFQLFLTYGGDNPELHNTKEYEKLTNFLNANPGKRSEYEKTVKNYNQYKENESIKKKNDDAIRDLGKQPGS